MSRIKLHIKKGDVVKAIAGKNRGKTGKVLLTYPEAQRELVEGVNLVKKHMKPTQDNPEGGIVEREAPMHVSNLQLVEGAKGKKIEGAE